MKDERQWVEIPEQEYNSIFKGMQDFGTEPVVFASETDMTGYYHDGKPYHMTEWGIENEDNPRLKMIYNGDITRFYKM